MSANYPDERGRGVEPVSKRLKERTAKQWKKRLAQELREAGACDAAVYGVLVASKTSGGCENVQGEEKKP